ncbi:MAG: type IV pilin N-terminal domain-containing protein [Methanoculleus marisnigri]|nr:type IV pilin N-terminal domain-containing protein [Methanoculleus marisnigri]
MRDEAVSGVVGEMLMISLVLLLVAVFAVSLGNLLPTERAPTVTVMMSSTTDNVTLYHKGGDWVRAADLEVIVSNATATRKYRSDTFALSPEKQVFDLGSSITVPYQPGDEQVRLVMPREVLFSGEVR